MWRHPNFSPSSAEYDFGAVELDGPEMDFYRSARFYTDTRRPWRQGSTEDVGFSIVGWGRGSNVGGTQSCESESVHEALLHKRVSSSFAVERNPASGAALERVRGMFKSTVRTCGGDSGAPWFLTRGGFSRWRLGCIHRLRPSTHR